MKTCLLALILAFCHGIAHGELKWDRQRVELNPGPTDAFVDATFGFVNAGTEPVIVEKLEPSCGCTTATLPKMTIDPGERSQLVTRFDITGRRGLQTKTVTVHIKGEKEPVVLSLIVTIPDLVKISPALVIWEKGEAVLSKNISLQAMEGQVVKIVNVLSSEGSIKARLETVQEGRQYTISVTPGNTAAASFSVLTIEAEFQGQKKNLRAYAQVRDLQR
jgi:Protein of unknown function (DUF1573)